MLTLEEAVERLLGEIRVLPSEIVPLFAAHERHSAERVTASLDLPPFDNSSMDGYAVVAEDIKTASADHPSRLKIVGRIAAGGEFSGQIAAGQCARIFTGSPMPPGADAVVMQEDTIPVGDDTIDVFDAVKPWENVRFKGEDVKRGAALLQPGDELTAGALGLLGAVGISELPVIRTPRVALLATGSELTEPGAPLLPGQIYESNRTMLAALCKNCGAAPKVEAIIQDSMDATVAALRRAFGDADVVITSGGVSVGEFDHVKAAFEAIGGSIDFWKIAVRPGKPFVFGKVAGKYLFGLPGNPVSAFVTFQLLARPALLKMQGATNLALRGGYGTLAQEMTNRGDRPHFVRVIVGHNGEVRSSGQQASHMLASLARANALLEIPPGTTFSAGASVMALML